MFLAMMFVVGVAGGSNLTQVMQDFIESTKSVVPSILIIGFTRGILITMQEAMISDTIVHALSSLLKTSNPVLSAIGMLVLQSLINFFIDGSSSQATITMPIMAPGGRHCGPEPPDRRAGLLLRRRFFGYVLAHQLLAAVRPDGHPSEPVVPIHHTAVLHHGGAAVPVYGHFRLCVLSLSLAGLPSSAGTFLSAPAGFPARRGRFLCLHPTHPLQTLHVPRPIGERGWSFR